MFITFFLYVVYSIIINCFFWYKSYRIDGINYNQFIIINLLIPILNIIILYIIKDGSYIVLGILYFLPAWSLSMAASSITFFMFVLIHFLLSLAIKRFAIYFADSISELNFTMFYAIIVSLFLTNTVGIVPLMVGLQFSRYII